MSAYALAGGRAVGSAYHLALRALLAQLLPAGGTGKSDSEGGPEERSARKLREGAPFVPVPTVGEMCC